MHLVVAAAALVVDGEGEEKIAQEDRHLRPSRPSQPTRIFRPSRPTRVFRPSLCQDDSEPLKDETGTPLWCALGETHVDCPSGSFCEFRQDGYLYTSQFCCPERQKCQDGTYPRLKDANGNAVVDCSFPGYAYDSNDLCCPVVPFCGLSNKECSGGPFQGDGCPAGTFCGSDRCVAGCLSGRPPLEDGDGNYLCCGPDFDAGCPAGSFCEWREGYPSPLCCPENHPLPCGLDYVEPEIEMCLYGTECIIDNSGGYGQCLPPQECDFSQPLGEECGGYFTCDVDLDDHPNCDRQLFLLYCCGGAFSSCRFDISLCAQVANCPLPKCKPSTCNVNDENTGCPYTHVCTPDTSYACNHKNCPGKCVPRCGVDDACPDGACCIYDVSFLSKHCCCFFPKDGLILMSLYFSNICTSSLPSIAILRPDAPGCVYQWPHRRSF